MTHTKDKYGLFLAEHGFSYKVIGKHLNMTKNQVSYFLKKNKARVKDYRNGKNHAAKIVITSWRIKVHKKVG